MDQLTLGMDAEPARRIARHRAHPAQPTAAKLPSRYRLIPIARLKVMSPDPGALVAEAGGPGVEARELGYARDPAAVAAVVAPYFAAVQADQEEFVVLVLNTKLRIVQLIPLFRGGMMSAPVDTKVVLRAVLVAGGAGFVAAHNHPSGAPRSASIERSEAEPCKECAVWLEEQAPGPEAERCLKLP